MERHLKDIRRRMVQQDREGDESNLTAQDKMAKQKAKPPAYLHDIDIQQTRNVLKNVGNYRRTDFKQILEFKTRPFQNCRRIRKSDFKKQRRVFVLNIVYCYLLLFNIYKKFLFVISFSQFYLSVRLLKLPLYYLCCIIYLIYYLIIQEADSCIFSIQ